MTITPLGDSAVVMRLSGCEDATLAARAQALAREIAEPPLPGVVDVVAALGGVAVFFDLTRMLAWSVLENSLRARAARVVGGMPLGEPRLVEIPVCYGGAYGPDLEGVAAHTRQSLDDVAARHQQGDYWVQAIGFSPGFPYLAGLPEDLATPRRATPRARVPAGAVGIGGAQTGVYPFATPGGWNIIGRTPLQLFSMNRAEPALLRAGDRVRFYAMSAGEFAERASENKVTGESEVRGEQMGSGPRGSVAEVPGPWLEVVRPGLATTVQDGGRYGHRARGVPVGGAVDGLAWRLANLLVGNSEEAAGLEFTLVGPELRFSEDSVVALTGAEFAGLPRWRPLMIKAGTVLKLGPARSGCRGYLAVAGGLAVPPVLGSRSTWGWGEEGAGPRGGVRAGDVLAIARVSRKMQACWRMDERILPAYSEEPVVRVIRGAQAGDYFEEWLARGYTVSACSDRMGVRLLGEPLRRIDALGGGDFLSQPVVPGTIQVPPDGRPIVMLADAQTMGGYPQVAHVISVDLPLMAQLRPQGIVRFVEVALEEARRLVVARAQGLQLLQAGVATKIR
ncbi:MAG: hypothetical protein RL077_6335 [Verrucomicrobiota bacterium]|jgi:KipI family sensor histidine kinase inhibitor